jgi:hypothetical protein
MKTKETIIRLLEKYPSLKDDDSRLIANYWNEELIHKGVDIKKLTATDFIKMFSNRELTNPETIRRTRAKLQEENPDLRGKIYKLRQVDCQKDWQEQLGYMAKSINKL